MSEEQAPPTGAIPESGTVPTSDIPKAFFEKVAVKKLKTARQDKAGQD